MRRTQAGQISLPLGPAPIVLAEMVCTMCSTPGVTIVGLGRNDNGAIELCYCSIDCARRAGWPWIGS